MRILCGIVILLRLGALGDIAADEEGRLTRSWWDAVPRLLTDIATIKANILTAAPLELASNIIDAVCKDNVLCLSTYKKLFDFIVI